MKYFIHSFRYLMLLATMFFSITASAYDFEVDGIYYNIVSATQLTCCVTSGENKYVGDLVIPSTVNYRNKVLRVRSIAVYAFDNCSNLTSITIPRSVDSIKGLAFSGCTGLKKNVFEDGESILELGDNIYTGLFNDCPIETLYIGRNLHYDISPSNTCPFSKNKSIKNVTIGNSVYEIYPYAFYECSGLTSVTCGKTLGRIWDYAFYGCSSLTTVTISSDDYLQIDTYAFRGCVGLTSITSLSPTPPTLELRTSSFTNEQYMDVILYVPKEAVSAYQSAANWGNFWNIQGIDVTGIQRIEATKQTPTAIYDLQGRKLTKPKKGINIIGGKKILVK